MQNCAGVWEAVEHDATRKIFRWLTYGVRFRFCFDFSLPAAFRVTRSLIWYSVRPRFCPTYESRIGLSCLGRLAPQCRWRRKFSYCWVVATWFNIFGLNIRWREVMVNPPPPPSWNIWSSVISWWNLFRKAKFACQKINTVTSYTYIQSVFWARRTESTEFHKSTLISLHWHPHLSSRLLSSDYPNNILFAFFIPCVLHVWPFSCWISSP